MRKVHEFAALLWAVALVCKRIGYFLGPAFGCAGKYIDDLTEYDARSTLIRRNDPDAHLLADRMERWDFTGLADLTRNAAALMMAPWRPSYRELIDTIEAADGYTDANHPDPRDPQPDWSFLRD